MGKLNAEVLEKGLGPSNFAKAGRGVPVSDKRQPSFRSKTGNCKFNPELLASLSSVGSAADSARSQFWIKYEEVASDFDTQFMGRLENDVDVSMLFAGLFSAVSTAFITASQSNITTVDPSAIANVVNSGGLVSSLAWTTALSYASLSTSLLAAFASLLAKQWLGHFKATRTTHGSLSSRGIHRQRKFDATQSMHFNTILDCIPVLLQLSLLLFSISLLGSLWRPYHDVAGVILAATGIGFLLYLVTFFMAMLSPDSPFQTLPSQFTQLVLKSLLQLPQLVQSCGIQVTRLVRHLTTSSQLPKPKFIPLSIPTISEEAPAVRWLLQISTDPAVVTAVAKMVPEVDWPVNFDLTGFVKPLWETFKSCFKVQSNDNDAVDLSCSNVDRACACSKALCHLYSEALYGDPELDLGHIEILPSVRLCLASTKNLTGPQESTFFFICALISLIVRDPTPAASTPICVPEEELSWVSHIISAFLRNTNHAGQAWVELAASIIPKFARYEPMPSKVLANYWTTIALILGMPINLDDLPKVDKSSAVSRLREEVCAFVASGPRRCKAVNPKAPSTDSFALALDLIFRVLTVEQGRKMIAERDLDRWIARLCESLVVGEDTVWDNNGCATIKFVLRTGNLQSLIRGADLRRSNKYIYHLLECSVESRNAEAVGHVLPLWLDDSHQGIDHDLCFGAITLLLRFARWYQVAFHSVMQVLNPASRHTLQDLLQSDADKRSRLFNAFPLLCLVPTPNLALDYLRVVLAMTDYTFFHGHLLTQGFLRDCTNTRAVEGAKLPEEHSFLLLAIVASVGTCSDPTCIEAAVHPDAAIVQDYHLEWRTIISAVQYIGQAHRDHSNAECITRIADYLEPICSHSNDVPKVLSEAIELLESKIVQTSLSALDFALVRLVHVLGTACTPFASPQ